MKKVLHFLNPLHHLGDKNYPILFSLLFMICACVVLEIIVNVIVKDPAVAGSYAIFPFVAFVIYFAFRAGIRGGVIAAGITILYYLYIIFSRNMVGEQFENGLNTTIILALLYLLLGGVIGGLKQRIDTLLEQESGEKRRLQAILQQLPVGVIVVGRNGKIEHSNEQVEKLLGHSLKEGLAGNGKIKNTAHTALQLKPTQWPLTHTLATGKAVKGKEIIIEHEHEKKVYLSISAAPIQNREGKMISAASVINDITEQKILEERKDDFINMASHELKTPITSMKLYIEALKSTLEKQGDARSTALLLRIKDQTERLQHLVYDLLDVSRIQTGKLSFTKERVRLDNLIAETVELLQSSAKQNILFTNTKPVVVYADKFRLYQVITNLITNAIKYSDQGKEIIVKIEKKAGKVTVSIQDFGIGITRDQQKKIFERLYQAREDKGNTFPGFGMGLFIAKEIIDRHKGKIWVESEKGKGSTFFFSLPIEKKK